MEVLSPTWDAKNSCYIFRIQNVSGDTTFTVDGEPVCFDSEADKSALKLPVFPDSLLNTLVHSFIDQTKRWFTTPLVAESIKKRLRHVMIPSDFSAEGWHMPIWAPTSIITYRDHFDVCWSMLEWKSSTPKISADFLMGSMTPRAQSPEPQTQSPEQPQTQDLRTIQIQDTLIPVGDLPLSDLPPLAFYNETADGDIRRQEIRQKIREARLRVALAKLKAERMEQRYYERYGESPVESEDSSELSTDSDSGDEGLRRQTYS